MRSDHEFTGREDETLNTILRFWRYRRKKNKEAKCQVLQSDKKKWVSTEAQRNFFSIRYSKTLLMMTSFHTWCKRVLLAKGLK